MTRLRPAFCDEQHARVLIQQIQVDGLLLADVARLRFETGQRLRVRGDAFGHASHTRHHQFDLCRHDRLRGQLGSPVGRMRPRQIDAERDQTREQHQG
jgi:hypothetical protein